MVLSQTLSSGGLIPSLLVFQQFGFSMELKRESKAPVQSLHICTRKGIILSVSAKLGVLPVVGLQAVLCQVGFGYRRSSYQLPEVLEPSHRGHKLLRSHCCITPHEQGFFCCCCCYKSEDLSLSGNVLPPPLPPVLVPNPGLKTENVPFSVRYHKPDDVN